MDFPQIDNSLTDNILQRFLSLNRPQFQPKPRGSIPLKLRDYKYEQADNRN